MSRPIPEAQRKELKRVSKGPALTPKEREAIKALQKLAETWPPTLTLLVTSSALTLTVIRTPKEGDDAMDDLGFAQPIERISIPVNACS
jgi:hypothetical protein